MKFKKVEISAFRIYDDPKDATFDLTTDSGNAAAFVSLYAPNGFGKTSFYDAVEFAVTDSINRFFIRRKELEKLADFQLLQNEVPLIRNSKSGVKRHTYVKIFTTSESEPEITRTFKKHGNQTHDLNFNKKPISHEFQKVILSQEWIAAFLTEQDGEYRYEKFMEIPELSNINEYYNKLKQTCSIHEAKKNKLRTDIAGFQKSVQNVDSKNILDTANGQIQLLIEQFGEQLLTYLSITSTQEDVKKLKDIIANRIISSNRELALIELLQYVDVAKLGSDSTIGLITFFSIQELIEKYRTRLIEIQLILEKFENLERVLIEIDNVKRVQKIEVNHKNEVDNLISDFTEYERIFNEVQDRIKAALQAESIHADIFKQLGEFNRIEIELRGQFETVLRELQNLETQNVKIPEMKAESDFVTNSIQKVETELNDKVRQFEETEKVLREVDSDVLELRRVIKEITEGRYPHISRDQDQELGELVETLKKYEVLLADETKTLMSLNTTIRHQQTLNQEISDFIKTGLSIVDRLQSSTCPLCEYKYDSYSLLFEKITKNTALDETLRVHLTQKGASELRISELTITASENRERLLRTYVQQLDKLSIRRQEERQLLDGINRAIKDLNGELSVLRKKLESHQNDLHGLSFEKFEQQISEMKVEANMRKDAIVPRLDTNKEAIDEAKQTLNSLGNQIQLLRTETESLIANQKYLSITEWFSTHYPDNGINNDLLHQTDLLYTQSISKLTIKLQELEQTNIALNQELTSFRRDDLVVERTELEILIQENAAKLNGYLYFLKDKLDIDSSQLNEAALSDLIEQKQNNIKFDLEQTRSLQMEYQKLEKFSENVWPFLQSENAKLQLAKTIEGLDFLERKIEPVIKMELSNTRAYLDSRIKDFFHEDLINTLYRKIDPHPDFKSVKFKANFDSDNPRLDVFVENTKNENVLIPNLYFSTAQINILSLSIFLANALNSKDYQCIFIDDPIQSMDTVNVLSTIDLLRSIVVNEGRQIVLSTHDENFFNLLKKKIPPELFESKFLELESFGKVKAS